MNPSGQGAATADPVRDATTATFVAEVVEASKTVPVLVDFWAEWCAPCKQLTPVLEKVVREAKGAVRLVKVNADENQDLAQQLQIQSLPTVMAFKDGQPVDGFMGALPESQIKAFIDKIAGGAGPSPADQLVEAANAALEDGDAMAAIEACGRVLQAEPDHAGALGGMARAHVALGKFPEARQILDAVPDDKKTDAAITSAEAALKMAEQAANAGDLGELEAKVAADENDHQARFDLALALQASGRLDEAADALLEIVRRDREWNEDGARQQLVDMFEAEGPTSEFTIATRRKLSSVLFS